MKFKLQFGAVECLDMDLLNLGEYTDRRAVLLPERSSLLLIAAGRRILPYSISELRLFLGLIAYWLLHKLKAGI